MDLLQENLEQKLLNRPELKQTLIEKKLVLPIRNTPDKITCSRCVLSDNDTKNIYFDSQGLCNYCKYYDQLETELGTKAQRNQWINAKIDEIKRLGKNRKYDSILGLSGGVDSSYLALWAKQKGLRPLIVHFDNGWNTELAVSNIQQICKKLGFDLQTIVIDWNEFKELQMAYLKAGVVDIEAITDHAIYSTIMGLAHKFGIKYNLSGFNYATEAIMPRGWAFDKTDFTNIKDINKRFGKAVIKTFPHSTFLKKLWYTLVSRIETVMVLNYIDYDLKSAKAELVKELDWKEYGIKHSESTFTKFYQSYILPTKFGIDKRKVHLSNLICSKQITRDQALEQLSEPLYNLEVLYEEMKYVLKKLDITEQEFFAIMEEKPRKHNEFQTQKAAWNSYFKLLKLVRPWKWKEDRKLNSAY